LNKKFGWREADSGALAGKNGTDTVDNVLHGERCQQHTE
jgi:hypothetical protein